MIGRDYPWGGFPLRVRAIHARAPMSIRSVLSPSSGPVRRGLGRAALALVVGAALAASGSPSRADIVIPVEAQRHLGVRTAVLTQDHRSTQVAAFAKVLDPGPLAALEADLDTAVAASAASAAEARRSEALARAGEGMARKDAEAAVAQAKGDAAKLTLLRRRIGLEWGPGLARLPDQRRIRLIQALAAGKAALVQVDTPSNEGQPGARTVEIDIGDGSVKAPVLGASRNAEPRLQSSGLIALGSGPQAVLFSIGLTQSARINTSSSAPGVVIPRAAVVRSEGSDWAYVLTQGSHFERRRLADPLPETGGLFVTQGFRPGEVIAVQGAAALFAAEQGQPRQGG